MLKFFQSRELYLGVSLAALLLAFPLISYGMTDGPSFVWWLGLISLTTGALIPPVQRIFFPPQKEDSAGKKSTNSASRSDS